MLSMQAGLSGIRASQAGLDISANNIANADNPNHHRQSVILSSINATTPYGYSIGSGVSIDRIRRTFNALVEDSLTQNVSERNSVENHLDVFRQVESILSPGAGSLSTQLESLFNEITELTANPADPVRRTTVLQRAQSLAQELNAVAHALAELNSAVNRRISGEVETVNTKLNELTELNRRAEVELSLGKDAHTLLDIRDKSINELAGLIDIQQHKQRDLPLTLLAANRGIFIGNQPPVLSTSLENGVTQIHVSGREDSLTFGGGSLQALQEFNSVELPRIQQQVNDFAAQLSFAFDKVQSTGLPINEPHTLLRGSRSLSANDVPINLADPSFPVQVGQLHISVTDQATGLQLIETIEIDPATMTLEDIAAAISGIDHIQALTNENSRLVIVAEAGFAFDFASRIETNFDSSGLTGTSAIELSGRYSGESNDQLQYEIIGSGTVGVTDGLRLKVTNLNGTQVADIDIGSGYSPGTKLDVIDGVQIKLSSGTLVASETFHSKLIADADEGNLLVSLGLGTFFTGDAAVTLAVNTDLLDNPDLLATSRSGDEADTGNVLRFLKLRDEGLPAFNGRTLEEAVGDVVRETATSVQLLTSESSDLDVLGGRLEAERAASIGVDPNEEFVKMMQFQKSFEMSARIISVADENMQTLIGMVR